MPSTGTFVDYPDLLHRLPPLVKHQRTLAAQIATTAQAVKDEKEIRADIDQLLVFAGLEPGASVTCNGYDVRHHERAGSDKLIADQIVERLVAAGVDRDLVGEVLVDSTETGPPSLFATVTPTKGAKVRR